MQSRVIVGSLYCQFLVIILCHYTCILLCNLGSLQGHCILSLYLDPDMQISVIVRSLYCHSRIIISCHYTWIPLCNLGSLQGHYIVIVQSLYYGIILAFCYANQFIVGYIYTTIVGSLYQRSIFHCYCNDFGAFDRAWLYKVIHSYYQICFADICKQIDVS